MKRMTLIPLVLLTVTLLPTFSVQAESPVVFKPPQSGAPTTGTVGGGTRGIAAHNKQENKIQLLATKKIGLTSSATPTLYWYASKSSTDDIKLTIRSKENVQLLEKNIGAIKAAGIQTIHLSDYGVSLAAEQDYTWSITVENNAKNSSAAQFADATIRYTVPTTPLTDATLMAEAGYWYDAVNQLIETNSPQLESFLQQEGINITIGK
jgi:hypothetical protein